ncbi:hypothetical protein ACWF82_30125 [Nocardia sp. NPDC055053]
MKRESMSFVGAVAIAAAVVGAPSVAAFPLPLPSGSSMPLPTGSSEGQWAIIDGTGMIENLDRCWASGFPREVTYENRSDRTLLVFSTPDCTGTPVATVAPRSIANYYSWSMVAAR